jgi:hypothetical protein
MRQVVSDMKRTASRLNMAMLWAGRLTGVGLMLLMVTAWPRSKAAPLESWRLWSDGDGALSELVVHWTPEASAAAVPAWRDLLSALPGSVTVHVACPDMASYELLRRELGPVPPRLVPYPLGHPLTCWSRDRWLALTQDSGRVSLVLPEEEDAAAIWPGRAGDGLVGGELAQRLPGVTAMKRGWQFDGGDVVADAECAFVTERMLKRNLGIMGATPDEVARRLGALLQRRVIFLLGGPDHHACMVMMVAGHRRVVVGDPSLAVKILGARQTDAPALIPCGDDFSAATQARFDAVALACAQAGYAVTRIPLVPGKDGRAFLAWINGMIDERGGQRTYFMPSFRSAPTDLEAAAVAVWQGLGYKVVKTDCSACFTLGGSLRCLINVLKREGSNDHSPYLLRPASQMAQAPSGDRNKTMH